MSGQTSVNEARVWEAVLPPVVALCLAADDMGW